MKYRILEADDADHLADMVNKYLDDGWSPQGGVSVSLSETGDYRYVIYAQAIVFATGFTAEVLSTDKRAALVEVER